LRLVAFLMVWFSHSLPTAPEGAARGIAPTPLWWLKAVKDAGNFGVCVFFFLSAYLITELLRRERLATGTVHLRAFYLRRILRIWPLYLGVLAAYGLLGLRFHGFRIEPGRLLASLLLAGNWYIAFHPAILTPMRALWSLSVEEQFYLGWPVLARFAAPRLIAAVCVMLIASGQATLVWLAHHAAQPSMLHVTAWVNSLVQFQFFALGTLSALLLAGRQPHTRLPARAAMLAAAIAAMLLASGVCGIKRPELPHTAISLTAGYAFAALGSVLLFGAVLGLPTRLVPGWAVRLGQVSFGLYVFHETGFFFADAIEKHLHLPTRWHTHWVLALAANKALSLLFTIALAFASYHFWERPFLRLKDRFTFIHARRA
jgi:peptidoglycan/LPS O-acetylase OafA/YrhL